MLRVAIDAAPLLGPQTGVGVFARHLIEQLAQSPQVRLDAYALSGRGVARLRGVLPHNVGHIGVPMPARPLIDIWSRFDHPIAERWVGTVDVVHGTNFVVPPTKSAGSVVTVHDLTAVLFPEMCTGTTLRYPELIRRAIERGAHVHVQTDAVAQDVRNCFSIDAVHVVAPGVPAVMTSGDRSIDRPYVLAIGTIEPRKDFPMLVDAFEAIAHDHPDLQLVIAGSPGWGAANFVEKVEDSAFRERIHLLGRVDDRRRGELLCNAELLAYPSIYEGFGLPPLEAMSVDTPVVATVNPAVSEVVGDGAVLVDSREPNDFALAMNSVLEDSRLRSELQVRGRQRAREFSWVRSAAGIVDLYELASKSAQ